ncbi:hypothetical protein RugamoR57_03720 [Duganella caerulea]|uniref:hypothetical protein n=1 Tax=Duganella caerulea TaxID=2885762 RepID=UPI0030E86D5C
MTIEDSLFQTVPLGTNQQSECSPTDPGEPWRGALIRAPSQVTLPAYRFPVPQMTLRLPLCVTFRLEASSLYAKGPLVVVATDVQSGRIYRGEVVNPDPHPQAPRPQFAPIDPKLLRGLIISGYFNLNVASHLPLPAMPATYDILVEYGTVQSNQVRVTVLPPQ